MKLFFSAKFLPAFTIFAAIATLATTDARADSFAGESYGPFDYSNHEHRQRYLGVVDGNHFNEDVENLVRGQTGTVFEDLMYTLRIFPNHHRALNAMARLYRRDGGFPIGADVLLPLDDFFQRAILFSPRDSIPHMVYAIHFHRAKEYDNALMYYQNALKLDPNSVELHYNLGLFYADIEDYEKSLHHAKKAYEMGHPLAGLRNKLIRAEVWE